MALATGWGANLSWLYRAIVGGGMVVGEYFLIHDVIAGRSTLVSVCIALAVLFLLPRPTPRLVLFGARLIVYITMVVPISHGFDTLAKSSSWFKPWNSIVAFAALMGLFVWALAAFLPKRRQAAFGSKAAVESTDGWVNIPTVRFANVGGLEEAKQELRLAAENRLRGRRNSVVRNGILLYGPEGTGKNLIAEATAGEFGANFYHVRCPELMGVTIGSTGAEIRRVFERAAEERPIVVFLDEIDSIGSRKQPQGSGGDAGGGGREHNAFTTQLMQSIDRYRRMDGMLIIAATNTLDGLEPTLIREGRFDAKLRLDLPDEAGRCRVLEQLLRSANAIVSDVSETARRTPGWSPARLKGLVDRAALLAHGRRIQDADLAAALNGAGGKDRPHLEAVRWEDVVLSQQTESDLRVLIKLLRIDPSKQVSVPLPSGIVLVGPPGTGKTLTARLIASETRRSLYIVTPGDVLSGAVGGSVRQMASLFARAKENAPSILFFDEMDALFPRLSARLAQHDVQLVEQALIEMSGLKPEHEVLLVGTSNELSRIDPRILRGGRFSEKIEIGLPDGEGFKRLIDRHFGAVRLDNGIARADIPQLMQGSSPAEIEAIAIAARRNALARMSDGSAEEPPLELADLKRAIERVRTGTFTASSFTG